MSSLFRDMSCKRRRHLYSYLSVLRCVLAIAVVQLILMLVWLMHKRETFAAPSPHVINSYNLGDAEYDLKAVDKLGVVDSMQTFSSKSDPPIVWIENVTLDLKEILAQTSGDWRWEWMQHRMEQNWAEFVASSSKLKETSGIQRRKKRKILIAPGFISLTDFVEPQTIKDGGPLGELVQWSDLVCGLHVLGHELLLLHDMKKAEIELRMDLEEEPLSTAGSRRGCVRSRFELIYTDLIGYARLASDIRDFYRYKFRILDVYGTEAAYNDAKYATKIVGVDLNDMWGRHQLNLKQFYTFYPQSPDNSFLGFVISGKNAKEGIRTAGNRTSALLYGKSFAYLRGKDHFLEHLLKHFSTVHATIPKAGSALIDGIQNHGLVSREDYINIMKTVKLFVGLGDPVEGIAVMEALAQGCIFLNPRRRGAQQVLAGKPTSRRIESQVPYLEMFVGQPHVYTVDCDNVTEVQEVLCSIKRIKHVSPFLPYEFSVEGYIQRLFAYVQYQDLCPSNNGTLWPPQSSLKVVQSEIGASCIETCHSKDLVCEPVFFPLLNNTPAFKKIWSEFNCDITRSTFTADIVNPSYEVTSKRCHFQERHLLYSCAGSREATVRVCPCRDYLKQQIALCSQCLVEADFETTPGKL